MVLKKAFVGQAYRLAAPIIMATDAVALQFRRHRLADRAKLALLLE
jgi:hypothetical protein